MINLNLMYTFLHIVSEVAGIVRWQILMDKSHLNGIKIKYHKYKPIMYQQINYVLIYTDLRLLIQELYWIS